MKPGGEVNHQGKELGIKMLSSTSDHRNYWRKKLLPRSFQCMWHPLRVETMGSKPICIPIFHVAQTVKWVSAWMLLTDEKVYREYKKQNFSLRFGLARSENQTRKLCGHSPVGTPKGNCSAQRNNLSWTEIARSDIPPPTPKHSVACPLGTEYSVHLRTCAGGAPGKGRGGQ